VQQEDPLGLKVLKVLKGFKVL